VATNLRTRRQPRWVAAAVGSTTSRAAIGGGISLASSEDPPGALLFAVIVWAFVGGMSLADLLIPVSNDRAD